MVLATALVAASATAAAGHGHHGGHKVTCRGPGSLDGFFQLTHHREVKGKRTDCGTARKVVKHFPEACSRAYAAQGKCKVRASGRWRCRSHMVGSLEQGAPAREKCKRHRSKLK